MDESTEAKLRAVLFSENKKPPYTQGKIRTHAAVIIHRGCLIYEGYESGFDENAKHLLWSVSKSIMGLLVGAAEQDGFIRRNDSVAKYLSKKNPVFQKMTVEDLLFWSSGFEWQESYEFAPLFSDVVAMLYTRGLKDMSYYVGQRPQKRQPGERFDYSSGDSQLLSKVLFEALPSRLRPSYPWWALFNPLVINATFERDPQGVFLGSSYAYMSARDLAKIGQLYLNSGRWRGQQILPRDWVDYITSPPESLDLGPRYYAYPGGHVWLNQIRSLPPRWPSAPTDMFLGTGHWGQKLFVVPSKDLVIARFGDDRTGRLDTNRLFDVVMEVIKK